MSGSSPENKPLGAVKAQAAPSWRQRSAAIGSLIRLAAPISLSRLGGLLLVLVDVAMLGHVNVLALAYYGLASAALMVFLLTGIGMLIGIAILTAQARGAGELLVCGVIWRVGLCHALVMGLVFWFVSFAAEAFFLAIGQTPELARGAGQTTMALAFGLPGVLVFIASTVFLEALDRPRAGLVIIMAANAVNLVLNWLLIDSGPSAVAGVALATSLTRWLMAGVIILYILRLPGGHRFNLRGPLAEGWRISAKLRRIGYAFGLAQGLESMAFSSLSMFAGYLGASAIAAYQVTINLIALAFMGAIGVATATGLRVGHAIGRRDQSGVGAAGWGGVGVVVAFMALFCLLLELAPEALTRIFTDDAAILAIAVPTLAVAGFMLFSDGAQAVLMGALRGAGDVWVPTILHLCAFLFVMMPAAWLFAFPLGFGAPGLMGGALLGVTVAAVLLGGRFKVILNRRLDRL